MHPLFKNRLSLIQIVTLFDKCLSEFVIDTRESLWNLVRWQRVYVYKRFVEVVNVLSATRFEFSEVHSRLNIRNNH